MPKKLKEKEFYCVGCGKAVTIKDVDDICVATLKNGVPALKSECKMGHKLTKFISKDDKKKMEKKYGDC
jgi:hypothetical protein